MANDLVKRFIKKDGSQRISFYREEYAENPRDMTDEPLHCEDWSRDYSIMNKHERESKSSSARSLLEYMISNYGDYKKIIDFLVENGKHMTDGKAQINNALVYERNMQRWVLKEYSKWYTEKEYSWKDAEYFDCKKYDIDIVELLQDVFDSTIDYLYEKCMTDKAKVASYHFGYNGEVEFSDSVDCDADGIAWLEKDEFMKYSGCKEEYWNGKSLDEIEGLLDELKAWGNGDVYGFVVEDCIKSVIHKEYTNSDRDDECYEHEDWEESDSCWGYYGDIDEVKVSMFDQAGLDINEFEEENV